MSGEKGLASSRWAPINTGRPPYYWSSNKFKNFATTATTTATSTSSAVHTTNTGSHVSHPPPPSTTNYASTPAINQTTAAYSPTANGTPPNAAATPYQVDLSAFNRIPTPWAELTRFMKIARRMRWKLPFLAHGYRAATDRANEDREEAELMFKLDFFEYYMLLERALVHLMGVFGVKVTGALGARMTMTMNSGRREQGSSSSTHRFHANVLEALDDPRNPLHGALGRDDARHALARAKELRNRWKNADDPDAAAAVVPAAARLQASRPLEDYDLERILETIFGSFEAAYGVASLYVADVRALAASRGLAGGAGGDMRVDPTDEAQWEFMVDAMDWEAV